MCHTSSRRTYRTSTSPRHGRRDPPTIPTIYRTCGPTHRTGRSASRSPDCKTAYDAPRIEDLFDDDFDRRLPEPEDEYDQAMENFREYSRRYEIKLHRVARELGSPRESTIIELLRDIHDCTGVPILLIATKDLLDRNMRSCGPDHGRQYSRFDIVHHLSQGRDAYAGKPLFSVAEIKELYDHVPIRQAKDAASYLQDVANQLGYGSPRRCKILLRKAARPARRRLGLGDEDRVTVTTVDLHWVEARLRQEAATQDLVNERRKRAAVASG